MTLLKEISKTMNKVKEEILRPLPESDPKAAVSTWATKRAAELWRCIEKRDLSLLKLRPWPPLDTSNAFGFGLRGEPLCVAVLDYWASEQLVTGLGGQVQYLPGKKGIRGVLEDRLSGLQHRLPCLSELRTILENEAAAMRRERQKVLQNFISLLADEAVKQNRLRSTIPMLQQLCMMDGHLGAHQEMLKLAEQLGTFAPQLVPTDFADPQAQKKREAEVAEVEAQLRFIDEKLLPVLRPPASFLVDRHGRPSSLSRVEFLVSGERFTHSWHVATKYLSKPSDYNGFALETAEEQLAFYVGCPQAAFYDEIDKRGKSEPKRIGSGAPVKAYSGEVTEDDEEE